MVSNITTAKTGGNNALPAYMPLYTGGQKVSFDGSTQSTAISASVVLLYATTACAVLAGANPTAALNGGSLLVPAGALIPLVIEDGHKIAAIKFDTAGDLYIMPLR